MLWLFAGAPCITSQLLGRLCELLGLRRRAYVVHVSIETFCLSLESLCRYEALPLELSFLAALFIVVGAS